MKKLLTVLFAVTLILSAALSAQAIELKPFQATDPCYYVKEGGTCEFQTWDTETSYTVADETIATVDENGVIHGLKAGRTTMDVVVFDEEFASWIDGGYSFTQDIEVYEAGGVLSLGDNYVESSATFTPAEDGYYSFTGSDIIRITGDDVDHWAAANYHDDTEYVPSPICYLKAGVTYTVSASDYDETYIIPVATVIIAKSDAPSTTAAPTTAAPTEPSVDAAPKTGDSANALVPSMLLLSGAALWFLSHKKNSAD